MFPAGDAVVYRVDDSPVAVGEFYKAQMAHRGWRFKRAMRWSDLVTDASVSQLQGAVGLVFMKPSTMCTIGVMADPAKPSMSMVSIRKSTYPPGKTVSILSNARQ